MHHPPLHTALINNLPLSDSLLKYDPLEKNGDGFTALSLAKYLGRTTWTKALLGYPSSLADYYTQQHSYIFTPHLLFSSYDDLVRAKQQTPEKIEWIEFGEQFDKEIFEGSVLDAEIRHINNEAGFGLFSKKKYQIDSFIGEYVGLVGEHTSYLKLKNYLYKYPVPDSIGRPLSIDAENHSNHVRFINHSFTPNCIMVYAITDGIPHAILMTTKEISPGEQFTYNYGESFWNIRNKSDIIKF